MKNKKYQHSPQFIFKQTTNLIAKNAATSIDNLVRDVLVHGDQVNVANPGRWYYFQFAFKRKVRNIRISIAEWIGGEDLHEYCDY
jgi:hypothetical protein